MRIHLQLRSTVRAFALVLLAALGSALIVLAQDAVPEKGTEEREQARFVARAQR